MLGFASADSLPASPKAKNAINEEKLWKRVGMAIDLAFESKFNFNELKREYGTLPEEINEFLKKYPFWNAHCDKKEYTGINHMCNIQDHISGENRITFEHYSIKSTKPTSGIDGHEFLELFGSQSSGGKMERCIATLGFWPTTNTHSISSGSKNFSPCGIVNFM